MHVRTPRKAHTHRRTIFALLFGVAFSTTLAYAVPPLSQYTPAETLDPNCAPGDTNCSVLLPSGGGAFIPLAGTDVGSLVTGDIQINEGTKLYTSSGVLQGSLKLINLSLDSELELMQEAFGAYGKVSLMPGVSTIETNDQFTTSLTVHDNQIIISTTNSNSRGIIGLQDYTANITDLDYTQKKYVDDQIAANMGGGSSVWGGITGTLSDQTDLQSALDAKFDTPSGTTSQYIRGDGTLATYIPTPITIQNTNSLFSTGLLGTGANSNAQFSNFLGFSAGNNAQTVFSTNFIGPYAGYQTTGITASNFIGNSAGQEAVNASNSNFIGTQAGAFSSGASNSIFIGSSAGIYDTVDNTAAYDDSSTFADTSILIGHNTSTGGFSNSIALGAYATNTASNQLVIGSDSRLISSVFIGGAQGAASTLGTTFIGARAGQDASAGDYANFLGQDAGNGATNASYSIFMGASAGINAINATRSIFIGNVAGGAASEAGLSVFIGNEAGYAATDAYNGTFIGASAGSLASNAYSSTFIGNQAGNLAVNAFQSTFVGSGAGNVASDAAQSVFIGASSGGNASNAVNATFLGVASGNAATNASNSVFIGSFAGYVNISSNLGSVNAANSIFIGTNAGTFAADNGLNNTAAYNDTSTFANTSILIGHRTSTGGFSNSIAMGAYATNTSTNQFMVGSSTRRIDTLVFNGGTGNTCSVNASTGITCSSDERLKTNIQDLDTTTLDKVLALRTVRYNWISHPDDAQMIGFIAQNLQTQFPELITQNIDGMLSVNYAQMTPILTEAIREMNSKITDLTDLTKTNTWRDALIHWFGSAGNGIAAFFSTEVTTKRLCVADDSGAKTCLTKGQVDAILSGQSTQSVYVPSTPSESVAAEEETAPSSPSETEPSSPTDTTPVDTTSLDTSTEDTTVEETPSDSTTPTPPESTEPTPEATPTDETAQ